MKTRTLIPIAILVAACCLPLTAQSYTFESVDCNSLAIHPSGMNGFGVVVGTTGSAGVTYFNGKCQAYPSLFFYGVSDTDWLIAFPAGSPNNTFYLVEPGGKTTTLPNYPGLDKNFAYCCMDTAIGTLAGNYTPPGIFGAILSGFFYHKGKFTSLPWSDAAQTGYWYQIAALNNTGTTVGTYNSTYLQGFVYQKGKMTLLRYPSAKYTYFQGLNDNGVIVGSFVTFSNTFGVFLYNIGTGTWTDLNFGSEREFDGAPILCRLSHLLKFDEFGIGDGHAFGLEQ